MSRIVMRANCMPLCCRNNDGGVCSGAALQFGRRCEYILTRFVVLPVLFCPLTLSFLCDGATVLSHSVI